MGSFGGRQPSKIPKVTPRARNAAGRALEVPTSLVVRAWGGKKTRLRPCHHCRPHWQPVTWPAARYSCPLSSRIDRNSEVRLPVHMAGFGRSWRSPATSPTRPGPAKNSLGALARSGAVHRGAHVCSGTPLGLCSEGDCASTSQVTDIMLQRGLSKGRLPEAPGSKRFLAPSGRGGLSSSPCAKGVFQRRRLPRGKGSLPFQGGCQ